MSLYLYCIIRMYTMYVIGKCVSYYKRVYIFGIMFIIELNYECEINVERVNAKVIAKQEYSF